MLFLIKFFPEITVKSKVVRRRMSRRLKDNLYRVLRPLDGGLRIFSHWDKITVQTTVTDAAVLDDMRTVLASTPGIACFFCSEAREFDTLEDIARLAAEASLARIRGRSFVVRCKRSGQHDFTSHDIERYVGGYLLQHGDDCRVDLHQPEVTVLLEVHGQTLYLISERVDGLGGFPLGELEPVLSLISGGFDSPVASFLTMKRGMPTHFCFFNLGGRAHELGVKEVAWHLWQRYGASQPVQFVTVPFEAVVAEILDKVDNAQMGVVLKRMMLRAAGRVADQLGIDVLVTGEAVAQVSSQTLTNLSVIDKAADRLVLRPLVTTDKEDIVRLARRIGTDGFAARMPEYCGVISVKPTTRARLYRIEAEEEKFDDGILDAAVAGARYSAIDALAMDEQPQAPVEEFAIPQPDAVIVDIRAPDEQQRRPLQLAGQTVELLPFYRLHSGEQAGLDRQRHYLLYCEKGVMSRLHADFLREEGFRVGVYRPVTA
ncbi:MAG TPA: tRNA uracil 4-sulfurtransferase ThiI [Pseudomonadales bacterium]